VLVNIYSSLKTFLLQCVLTDGVMTGEQMELVNVIGGGFMFITAHVRVSLVISCPAGLSMPFERVLLEKRCLPFL
jgi:hypothetical protein